MRFQCSSCEKFLRINDALAGKKVKCPNCGAVQLATAAPEDEAIQTAPPVKKQPVASVAARAPVKRRPDDDEAAAPMPRRTRRPVADDDDDDAPRARRRRDEDDEDDRPRKKRRKQEAGSSKLLIWLLAGGGGLLLVVGVVVAVIILLNRAKGDNDEPRMIKWDVPHKVGMRRRVTGVHEKTMKSPDQNLQGQVIDSKEKVEFEGEITTLAVNAQGRETKAEVVVKRLVDAQQGNRPELLPAGSRVVATVNGNTVNFDQGGGFNPNMLRLSKFLHMTEDDVAAGQRVFGAQESRKPGSTWPIDKREFADQVSRGAKGLFTVLPEEVSGTCKFVGVVKQDGKEHFDLELNANFKLGRKDAKLFIVRSATIDIVIKARLTADHSTPPVSFEARMLTKAEYEIPQGQPGGGQVVRMDMTEFYSETTAYLSGGDGGGGAKKR